MPVSLRELAEGLEARLVGNGDRSISGIRSLETAEAEHVAVYSDPRYREAAERSRAGALVVGEETSGLDRDRIVVDDPGLAMARLLRRFHPEDRPEFGRHPSAVVADSAEVDPGAHIGPLVVVGHRARIGAGAVLHPGVVVGEDCVVGEESVLHPRVVLYPEVELGSRVVVHAGSVLGADGFGYVESDGELVKVPQVGRVRVEDDVEIGANSAIDRGTLDETVVGRGSKLDNLVQIGHNAVLGPGCVVCGLVGVAGSATLGAGVVLGGQAGVSDHLSVGEGTKVAGKSAVLQSIGAGETVAGIPAIDLARWRRQVATLRRLEDLVRRVRHLERRLESGEGDWRRGEG